jgi:hypothetical protein
MSIAVTGFALFFFCHPCSAEGIRNINERLLVIHAAPSLNDRDPEQSSCQNAYEGIVEFLTGKGYRIVEKNRKRSQYMEN